MGLFDTHAHYDDPRFDEDRDRLLTHLPEPSDFGAGVDYVVNQGCDLASSRASLALAEAYPHVYAAVGIHPENCLLWNDETADEMRNLLAHPKAVAIGEIGLDRHWEGPDCPWDAQVKAFQAQLALAKELDLPVCVHDREAHGETFDIIRRTPGVTGVLHAYSGSGEMARQAARLGWYLGFGGTLTFKNARNVREAAAAVPPDRLLLETDCPYLAPVPWRGERNDSRRAWAVCAVLAEIHGVPVAKMAEITRENALRFYRL